MRVLRRILAVVGRVLAVLLVTVVLLEVVLRAAYPLTPAAFRLHLMESLPPDALPAYAGEMGWALREFPSQLLAGRALTEQSNPKTDSDLYLLTCATPPADTSPGFTVSNDEFGFRVDQSYPLAADDPDVLVLGDSFGASSMIQYPFWQNLTERTWGLAVSMSGPTEQANILRAVLDTRNVSPAVIVVQYFEGNDLTDAKGYTVRLAEYSAAAPPEPSPLARLYTAQLGVFLWERSGIATPNVLPPEAARAFNMWVDAPPTAETPVPIYQGDPAWGWAFDTRAGQTNTIGVTRVRLHAGETCDGPLLSVDNRTRLLNALRPDIPAVFGFPQTSVFTQTGFRLPLNTDLGVQTITVCAESITGEVIFQTRTVDAQACPLPLSDENGQDILFFPHYLGMATLSAEAITASEGYANTEAALLEMQALADRVGAELVLLYLPSKIHTYLDVLDGDELRKMDVQFQAYGPISGDPYRSFGPIDDLPTDEVIQRLQANIAGQRSAIEDLATRHNIPFVDATPALQRAAAAGEQPFHPADTHINDTGSAIIREVLREAIAPYLE
jgi:hypothetical protein